MEPPSAEQLFQQAQVPKSNSAPGLDGWAPYELRILLREAWTIRRRLLLLSYDLGISPEAYYLIPSPVIQKTDKYADSTDVARHYTAEEYRVLGLTSAIYRVEAGASYRQHLPWMTQWIHKDLHGSIPEHESADVSWDAQSHIELSKLKNQDLTILLMDYYKFFDSFDFDWVRSFMIALGFNPQLAELIHNLNSNMIRFIKLGKTFGPQIKPGNGMLQGDSFSIIVALALVSIQFHFIDHMTPKVPKGCCR